jgi:hypothetical protein
VATPRKWPGRKLAVKLMLNPGRVDMVLLWLGVELSLARCEQQVDAGRGEQIAVGLKRCADSDRKSSFGPNWRAIDEKCWRRTLAPWLRASLIKAMWAGVQVTHGRNEGNTLMLPQRCAQLGDRRVNLHDFLETSFKLARR